MKARIVLGCHGRKLYGLTLCEGVSNYVLDLRKVPDDMEDVYSYLDNHCKLFDRMATDQNKIGNIISYLVSRDILPKHGQEVVLDFIAMHRKCGLFMFVEPIQESKKNENQM